MLFWKSLRICFFHIYQIYVSGMAELRNGGKYPQILKDGIAERRNGEITERRKLPQILKDGIAESRNAGKYPQILKDGMTENHPKS